MGMSTSVTGIKPADEKFKKMKAIWDACVSAEIEVPNEVGEFFDWETPDPSGVKVYGRDISGVREYNSEYESGYEIQIDQLPKDIKIIRVTNSW